jgi:hypothetical protein
MAQFTPEQINTMTAAVTGQCEAASRMNIWRYNFGSQLRRGRSVHALASMASASIGFALADMPRSDVTAVQALVLSVVQEYDRRNHIAPAF